MLAWWMAFGCCQVVAAGIVFLESCSMSLLKTSAWGKALRSHRVRWGSHPAFLLESFAVMRSQTEKGSQRVPKDSEGKKMSKVDYYVLKPWMCFLNLWISLPGVRKEGQLKTGHSREGQACTLGPLIQTIIYLIILSLPTGMVSLAWVLWGWDAVNVYEGRICHSCLPEKQQWWCWANSPMCIPAGMTPVCAQHLTPSLPHSWEGWHSCEWQQGQSGWTRIISRWLLPQVYILTWLPSNKSD